MSYVSERCEGKSEMQTIIVRFINISIYTKSMGKKFIMLTTQRKKYRLFSEDIKTVFIKHNRKIPHIPSFGLSDKNDDYDTSEEEASVQSQVNTMTS